MFLFFLIKIKLISCITSSKGNNIEEFHEGEITIKKFKAHMENIEKSIKLNATVVLGPKDDINLNQFRFAKLVLVNNNKDIIKQELYASNNSLFYNTDNANLYNQSQFKAVVPNTQNSNTILSVPLNKLEPSMRLYIRIPCEGICNFSLNYTIEDGRKMEGISINEKSCYDILLQKVEDYSLYYRFVYTTYKDNYPLITFTSSSSKNFSFFPSNMNSVYTQHTLVNGFSFMYRYSAAYYEYHTFLLQANDTMNFRVCHRRVINETHRTILIGEEVHSVIKNFIEGLVDCFNLQDNEYDSYIMNYITKTKGVRMLIDKGNKIEEIKINMETGNLFLDKSFKSFCFAQEIHPDHDEIKKTHFFTSVQFQILGVKNNVITQHLNFPLINGLSMQQNLKKGQILYYRLSEYLEKSEYINLYFQSLFGDVKVYKSLCENINCTFNENMLTDLKEIKFDYKNNIHLTEKIDKEYKNIYKAVKFPVFIVYCENVIENKFCHYFIGINTDDNYLVLNQNRKVYSYLRQINNNNETVNIANKFTFFYNFSLDNFEREPFFFEIHLLFGSISDIYVNGEKNEEDIFNYNNRTIIYSKGAIYSGFGEHYIEIEGENNSFFYIVYYFSYENNKVPYIFSERETQYKLMKKFLTSGEQQEEYYYSFPEREDKSNYIISINGINSYLLPDNYEYQLKFFQLKDIENDVLRISCGKDGHCGDACEFIISASKLNNGVLNKDIEYDGLYHYFKFEDEIKEINLYYYFSEEDLKSKLMLVNINKNNLVQLKVEYGFNKTSGLDYKLVDKYHEIFTINLSSIITINESYSYQDYMEKRNYFIIRITKSNNSDEDCNFKIKTNIKNVPTYLNLETVEFGYVNKYEPRYYYFDYLYAPQNQYKDNYFETYHNLQEIYLYNKGNVKMKVINLKGNNRQEIDKFDISNINYDNESIQYVNEESGKNYIKVLDTDCTLGCRFAIKVYLDENDENNEVNNYYTIHKNSMYGNLVYEFNTNIFGNFYGYSRFLANESYPFYINNPELEGDLIITLNCKVCYAIIYLLDDYDEIELVINSNTFVHRSKMKKTIRIDFSLDTDFDNDTDNYYYSLSDSEYPKYIEQLQSEPCFKSCEFVFPLHKYYNYSNDDKTQVIFYIPNDEQVKIYYGFKNISEFESDLIEKFDLTKNEGNKEKIPSNKLFFDLNVKDIKENEKYLIIQIISEENNDLNFVMNKFIFSPNIDEFKHSMNIVSMNTDEIIKNDIISLDNDTKYKIDIYLINGNGVISLDNSGKYVFVLNYQTQEYVSLIIDLPEFNISSRNYDTNNNFTFYINATNERKLKNFGEFLDFQKIYRIKYFKKNGLLFPMKLKISTGKYKNKYLYINYRFIELEKNEKREELYNTTDEMFATSFDTETCRVKLIEKIYFPEFRRGFIMYDIPSRCEDDHLEFTLRKNITNTFTYQNVFLEITPLYLDKKEHQDINIPKNTYIQINLNKTANLIFTEMNPEYNHIIVDIANTTEIIFKNIDDFNCNQNNGKLTCISDKNKTKYSMAIEPNLGTIFIKFTSRKEKYPYFELTNNTVIFNKTNEEENTFRIKHEKIKIIKGVNDTNNAIDMSVINISYYIRVYDYYENYKEKDINNILYKSNAIMSFRKEINTDDVNSSFVEYELSLGNSLAQKSFYINIIAEAVFNGTVEYFSYKSNIFIYKPPSEKEEESETNIWIYIIPAIAVVLLACIGIIIYICIRRKKRKNEININVKDLNDVDVLINKSEKQN